MVLQEQLIQFFLLFVRSTSFIASSPFFGDRSVPRMVKIGLGGLLSIAVFAKSGVVPAKMDLDILPILVAVASEVFTGLLLGFLMQFLFAAVQMAGEFIGMDMGLAMASQLDPQFNQQTNVVSQFYFILAFWTFILLNGDYFLIQAFSFSLIAIPVAGLHLSSSSLDTLIRMAGMIFPIAVKIAAPAIVALFLTSISMGIAARVVPQMNIFFVAIPLRIGVGLYAMILSLPLFFYVFQKLLTVFETQLDQLIRAL